MMHAPSQDRTSGTGPTPPGAVKPTPEVFRRRLERLTWGMRTGRVIEAAATGILRLIAAGTLLTAFDLATAPGVELRIGLDLAVLAVGAIGVGLGLARSLNVSAGDTARRIDEITGDPRRSVLAAWELLGVQTTGAAPESASLRRFLVDRMLARAVARVENLPGRRLWPLPAIRRRLRAFLFLVPALTVVAVPARDAVGAALLRICLPWRDVPPYSRYRFTVKPDPAVVLYGDAIELTAAVSGPRIRGPVRLTTRTEDGRTASALCFRRGERTFSLRVDHVVRPFDFCFRVGRRARSRWRRVAVRLEPRVEGVRLILEPPAYTHRTRRIFQTSLGSVRALRGTRARLEIRSNRPLSGGTLVIRSAEDRKPLEEVTGRRGPAGNTAVFAWDIQCSGNVAVRIRDIQGILSRTPLRFELTMKEDAPPAAGLSTPPPVSLATPTARLPISGWAEDDIGLSAVRWVRAVQGYRDRSVDLPLPKHAARYDFRRTLDLGTLGAAPGDVLEFYLEARDAHPEVPGVCVSDVARVTIISEDEYARILRARTTLEEVAARARAVEQALEAVRKAAEAVRAETGDGKSSPPDRDLVRRRIDALRGTLEQARRVLDRLAAELPVYANEKALHASLKPLRAALKAAAEAAAGMRADSPGLTGMLDSLLAMLGKRLEQARRDRRQAEQSAVIARLMQAGVSFLEQVRRQADIVQRLTRFEPENSPTDPDYVRWFADREHRIRTVLAALPDRIRAWADKLSDEYFQLRDGARAFAMDLELLKLPELLERAEAAMRAGDGRSAYRLAREALKKMQKLQRKYNRSTCYGGLCHGRCRFSLPSPDAETLSQVYAMLAGVGGGGGRGFGSSGYAGGYGASEHGYGMSGWAAAAAALYGPPRFQPMGGIGGRPAAGSARGDAACVGAERRASEKPAAIPAKPAAGRATQPRRVPDKYRKAVERYFAAKPGA